MKDFLDSQIIEFAQKATFPIYVVGGAVRNFLLGERTFNDIDICAPVRSDEFSQSAKEFGIEVCAEYKRTQTLKLKGKYADYEFTSFRTENYSDGGGHTPSQTVLTTDIVEDAKRRDFKCNAIYYDIKKGEIVDVLGGVEDVKNKVIDTVVDADAVFSHDGLRIMRLARFAGALGFTPTERTLNGCRKYADNLNDISVERIYSELKQILQSDTAYPFSPNDAHYRGLKILSEVGALDVILPELTAGRNMAQRSDFHKYDVLEHSLRTALYSDKEVRLASLLHDIAKPYCMINFGKYAMHERYGEDMSREVLKRFKADNKTIDEVVFLVGKHMVDLKMDMRDNKVKVFIAENYGMIDKLLKVKQADYRACYDYEDVAPTVIKWQKLIEQMREDGVPLTVKDLKITAKDLIALGYKGSAIKTQLEDLRRQAIISPKLNDFEKLQKIAKKRIESSLQNG